MSDAPAIDGFEHVALIGSGGFADVHRYRQRMPNRMVAVKILRAGELSDAVKRQFIVEANVMARLSNHPGIATIYTAGITVDDRPYLVMEYCPGGSLAERYRAAPLPIAEAVSIGVRMAAALESAHRLGVVHRDVKPANILVTEYGSPVLTDFGIALGHEAALESTMLQSLSTQGSTRDGSGLAYSVPWAAPEVLLELDDNDAVADVYSLAATIRTLVEGATPFEIAGGNNSLLAMSRRVERGESTPWSRTGVPDRLRDVIERGMAVDRASRYQSALEFAYALQSVEIAEGLRSTGIELLSGDPDGRQPTARTESDPVELEVARTVLRNPALPASSAVTSQVDTAHQRAEQEGLPAHSSKNGAEAVLTENDDSPSEIGGEVDVAPDESGLDVEDTHLRSTAQTAMPPSAAMPTRRTHRLRILVGGVAVLTAIAATGAVVLASVNENPTDTPMCGNLAEYDAESAVRLTLSQSQLDRLLREGIDALCGFSQPWEEQEYPAVSGEYHNIVFDGSGAEFINVTQAVSEISSDLECKLDSSDPFGPEMRESLLCGKFIDGELIYANVYHLGKSPPPGFSFVPEELSSSIVVSLRIPKDFGGWD